MHRQCDGRVERHDQRVPIENSWLGVDPEVGPQWREEHARVVHGDAPHHIAQRRTEEDGQQKAREAEGDVPELPPQRMVDMMTQLDTQRSEDEKPEHDHERQVKATKSPGVQHGERQDHGPARCQQPDLVAVPNWPNAPQNHLALRVGLRNEEMEHSRSEVETVEHHVDGEHPRKEHVPDLGKHHVDSAVVLGPRPMILSASETKSTDKRAYKPMKPRRVNKTLPLETLSE